MLPARFCPSDLLHLRPCPSWSTRLQGLNVQVWREYEEFVKELSSK
jgi:hypothetical protein